MNTILKPTLAALALIMFLSINANASSKAKKVVIQTSAVCDMCKARIEKALNATPGIETASLSLKDKKVTVKYNPSKTSPDKIREVISNTGYDADNVKRSSTAFDNLPHCCQKPMP